MLDRRVSNFSETVLAAALHVGRNAPRIADQILRNLFPRTAEEAGYEGAEKMLRDGVILATKRVLRQIPDDDAQHDFAEIDPRFHDAVNELGSKLYYVEALQEYVPVPRLIAEPALLNDARGYMRQKGIECIREADRLDRLYTTVTGGPTLDL